MDADQQGLRPAQRLGVAVVALLVVAVPLILANQFGHHDATQVGVKTPLVGRLHDGRTTHGVTRSRLGADRALAHGAAESTVRAALGSTTGAKNFAIDYQIVETPPTTESTPTTRPCPPLHGSQLPTKGSTISCVIRDTHDTTVTGHGVINVDPKRMVTSASIDSGSDSNLDVAVRVDEDQVWESIGGSSELAPQPNANVMGTPLAGFAGLTESTLGNRAGAVAMLAMASPNGYLSLESQAVDGAAPAGTATVDGTPVTVYQIGIDLSRLLDEPGLSTQGHTAITDAIKLLGDEGATDARAEVSVDAAGYIRRMVAEHRFADGGVVTIAVTVSDIGCAGTVGLPGQPPPPVTPADCVSPDDPAAVTTTTAAPAMTLSATTAPATTAAAPSSSSSSSVGSTGPSSTATTPVSPSTEPSRNG